MGIVKVNLKDITPGINVWFEEKAYDDMVKRGMQPGVIIRRAFMQIKDELKGIKNNE